MPAVPPHTNALVLVSGANGYIAMHVVDSLLKAGYRVRGTVRSESKAQHIRNTFKDAGDRLELVVVEDITQEGAFDEYVKDVDAVEHTASPVGLTSVDPQDLIRPALQGTTSVLKSVLVHGKNVKRVIYTSSCAAAITAQREGGGTFSEENWNEQSPREVEEKGREAAGMHKYRASKTLAEQAAWKLWNENKDKVQWDLVTLLPPFVFGPTLHEMHDAASLNTSMKLFWDPVMKNTMDKATLAAQGGSWVDVRDVARAHQLALEKPAAGGERIIISGGSFKYLDFVKAAQAIDPPPYAHLASLGNTTTGESPSYPSQNLYDASKAARVLGIGAETPYVTIAESTRDCLTDFKTRGWQP